MRLRRLFSVIQASVFKLKKIRCRSSGIFRLLENAESIKKPMAPLFHNGARAAGSLDLLPSRSTEGMRLHRQLSVRIAAAA